MSAFKNLKTKLVHTLREDLLKVKAALSAETKHTRQMIQTYMRYTQGEATKEEMQAANEQFRSFLKTIGLGALAVLPFAPVTIPAVVKLGQKLGIDIIPNSFKSGFKKP